MNAKKHRELNIFTQLLWSQKHHPQQGVQFICKTHSSTGNFISMRFAGVAGAGVAGAGVLGAISGISVTGSGTWPTFLPG